MVSSESQNAAMGFYFYPRGGSAQVARYLSRALVGTRWEPTVLSGSLGSEREPSHAGKFFSTLRCESLDYSPAVQSWAAGADPMAATVPMHASYEDKPGVPDRAFARLDATAFRLQVRSWKLFLGERLSAVPSVVHLHHLTPIHEAVHQLWPHVPVITHLHGTELKMLAAHDSAPSSCDWTNRMRRWAQRSARVVTVSAMDHQLAIDLLGVPAQRVVTIANGVDTEVFAPRTLTLAERLACWRRWLVDDPRGWRPGEGEGSVRYTADDMSAFVDAAGSAVPVVLYAGRFLRFKRLQLLIEAHHSLRRDSGSAAVLVIVGGYPGEWEGEHPYHTVQRLGAEGVFFVGWRDHADLAEALACSDVFAAPSVDEPFGLVYLEAMAAGVPPIATNTGGPCAFINADPHRPTGWMVPPDDVAAITQALAEAVSEPLTRAVRGRRAEKFVRERYSWAAAADEFAQLYCAVVAEPDSSGRAQLGRPTSGVAYDRIAPCPSLGSR